jgi:hypothetical protein
MVKQASEDIAMYQRILNVLVLHESKRRLTMAELAVKALLFFGLYIPLYIYSLVITFADVRFWILTAFIVITGSWRFVRWLRKDDRMNELRQQEIESKRIANRMQELEMRERELEIIERENKIIK